ncbi:hypothetical protein AAE478_004990 [Parahypoxylon ruwenzoriense]
MSGTPSPSSSSSSSHPPQNPPQNPPTYEQVEAEMQKELDINYPIQTLAEKNRVLIAEVDKVYGVLHELIEECREMKGGQSDNVRGINGATAGSK